MIRPLALMAITGIAVSASVTEARLREFGNPGVSAGWTVESKSLGHLVVADKFGDRQIAIAAPFAFDALDTSGGSGQNATKRRKFKGSPSWMYSASRGKPG